MRKVLMAILFLAIIPYSFADFRQETESEKIAINPKQITEASFKIVQSGILEISGDIANANITMHVPQDAESVKIEAERYDFVSDKYGNRLVLLSWKNPKGRIEYSIESIVKSRAFYAGEKGISGTKDFTAENSQMAFTAALREVAFPYERSMERAAELTEWVHDYVDYDLAFVGQLKPSDWVYDNRRGVCVEYSNLLGSLLRISGIPTRYVVGYAYSAVQNKLVGHTWVEVLADDGTWVPFDPTWLEGGYLDATHIKTAVREDANQTEQMLYFGSGKIGWIKNSDEIEILDYKVNNITSAALTASSATIGGYGYIKADVRPGSCTIVDINASSCSSEGSSMLGIFDGERKFWACGEKEVYWFFKVKAGMRENYIYTCPVAVYDQTGLQETVNVTVSGRQKPENVFIGGPDTAKINEEFSLLAEADGFIFYSPQLGKHEGKAWNLKLNRPGEYKFYLYSGSSLAEKTVNVLKEKEFNITIYLPTNATLHGTFLANVSVKNLAGSRKGTIAVFYDGVEEKQQLDFNPAEEKIAVFNLTASSIGVQKVTATVESGSISGYSASIYVYNPVQKEWWQKIIDDFIMLIIRLYSSIRI